MGVGYGSSRGTSSKSLGNTAVVRFLGDISGDIMKIVESLPTIVATIKVYAEISVGFYRHAWAIWICLRSRTEASFCGFTNQKHGGKKPYTILL